MAAATAGLSVEGCDGALVASGVLRQPPVLASTGLLGGALKRELDLNLTYLLVHVSGAPVIRCFSGNRSVTHDTTAPWDATGWESGEAPERLAARSTGVWLPWDHGLPANPDPEHAAEGPEAPDFTTGSGAVWVEAVLKPARIARQRALSPDSERPVEIPRMFFDRPVSPVKPVRLDAPMLGDLIPGLPDFPRF